MKAKLVRGFQNAHGTLGLLQIEGMDHRPLFTLENPQRATSVDSLIPAGVYKCKPYSGTKFKDVYEVCDVPGRSAILFHSGNTEADTLGCILVGLSGDALAKHPRIGNSREALDHLRELVGKNEFQLEVV